MERMEKVTYKMKKTQKRGGRVREGEEERDKKERENQKKNSKEVKEIQIEGK